MSGGTFEYKQYTLKDISDTLEEYINDGITIASRQEEKEKVIKILEQTIEELKMLYNKLYDIDYYLAGDYGFKDIEKYYYDAIEEE